MDFNCENLSSCHGDGTWTNFWEFPENRKTRKNLFLVWQSFMGGGDFRLIIFEKRLTSEKAPTLFRHLGSKIALSWTFQDFFVIF